MGSLDGENSGEISGNLQSENELDLERAGGRALRWEGPEQGGPQETLSLSRGVDFIPRALGVATGQFEANEGPNKWGLVGWT